LNKEKRPFKGVIYFGLILTKKGPKVLEYNARFGDPETQVILPLLKTDIVDVFDACIDGKLDELILEWEQQAMVCVILASGGYPDEYVKGYEISGLENIADMKDVIVYHAGTKKTDDAYYTNGGRVLGVAAKADTIDQAREKAYEAVAKISFVGMSYRKDIGIK
jgi:phosphoribosylamine--glycine ligase